MFGVRTLIRAVMTAVIAAGRIVHFPLWLLLRKRTNAIAALPAPPSPENNQQFNVILMPPPPPTESATPRTLPVLTPGTKQATVAMQGNSKPHVACPGLSQAPTVSDPPRSLLPLTHASKPTTITMSTSSQADIGQPVVSSEVSASPMAPVATIEGPSASRPSPPEDCTTPSPSKIVLPPPPAAKTGPETCSVPAVASAVVWRPPSPPSTAVTYDEDVSTVAPELKAVVVAKCAEVNVTRDAEGRVSEVSAWEALFGNVPRQAVDSSTRRPVAQPKPPSQPKTLLSGYEPQFCMGAQAIQSQAGRKARRVGRHQRRGGRKK